MSTLEDRSGQRRLREWQRIRKMWVDALRCGDYKQGKGVLRSTDDTGDSFCCLGVLSDLYVREGHATWDRIGEDHYRVLGSGWNVLGHLSILPHQIMRWVGLLSDTGKLFIEKYEDEEDDDMRFLVAMNDKEQNLTFAEIADVIESCPPGLFANSEKEFDYGMSLVSAEKACLS